MTIKKQYQEIVSFLEMNKDMKVEEILEQVRTMTESKVQSKTFVKDSNDNVVAIFCYYHKQWERVDTCEYGKKASSSTGLNTMCKLGVKAWTQQQNLIRQVDGIVLEKFLNEEIEKDDIERVKQDTIAEIKEELFEEFKRESHEYTTLEEIESEVGKIEEM